MLTSTGFPIPLFRIDFGTSSLDTILIFYRQFATKASFLKSNKNVEKRCSKMVYFDKVFFVPYSPFILILSYNLLMALSIH